MIVRANLFGNGTFLLYVVRKNAGLGLEVVLPPPVLLQESLEHFYLISIQYQNGGRSKGKLLVESGQGLSNDHRGRGQALNAVPTISWNVQVIVARILDIPAGELDFFCPLISCTERKHPGKNPARGLSLMLLSD